RSVTAFLSHPAIDEVVVALPAELVATPPEYLHSPLKPLRIVAGGERRQDSVANAFRAADAGSDVLVVHDAARPFASADLIARRVAGGAEGGAARAGVPARDTVKGVSGTKTSRAATSQSAVSGSDRTVIGTLPRQEIYLAQTPQAFRREVLAAALALD